MSLFKFLTLATTVSTLVTVSVDPPDRIVVDCVSPHALERALEHAKSIAPVDIYLEGMCEGHFRIETDGVTLRGMRPGSGLRAPAGNPAGTATLEITDAKASLRGLSIVGGEVGLLAEGARAEVLLYEVDLRDQIGVGLIGDRGAHLRVLDSTIKDAFVGIIVESGSSGNLQRVEISDHDVGIIVFDRSSMAINDSTISRNRVGGLSVEDRSDVNVLGTEFRDNGDVHVNATDWSSVRLLTGVTLGAALDGTSYAFGATREATVASYSTPEIHGDVSVLIGASVRFGNTVLHGDLQVTQFGDAHVRNAEIEGSVFCSDGADAICRQTTTGGVVGCPSTSCGASAPSYRSEEESRELPRIEIPRYERRAR